jgi:hypothetical protein
MWRSISGASRNQPRAWLDVLFRVPRFQPLLEDDSICRDMSQKPIVGNLVETGLDVALVRFDLPLKFGIFFRTEAWLVRIWNEFIEIESGAVGSQHRAIESTLLEVDGSRMSSGRHAGDHGYVSRRGIICRRADDRGYLVLEVGLGLLNRPDCLVLAVPVVFVPGYFFLPLFEKIVRPFVDKRQ